MIPHPSPHFPPLPCSAPPEPVFWLSCTGQSARTKMLRERSPPHPPSIRSIRRRRTFPAKAQAHHLRLLWKARLSGVDTFDYKPTLQAQWTAKAGPRRRQALPPRNSGFQQYGQDRHVVSRSCCRISPRMRTNSAGCAGLHTDTPAQPAKPSCSSTRVAKNARAHPPEHGLVAALRASAPTTRICPAT